MGFYDCCCSITGVTLIGTCTCVLLRIRNGQYQPIALPVTGGYDRQGAVDGIAEDRNSELMVAYFGAQRAAGRFIAEDETSNIPTIWPQPSPEYRSLVDGLIWLVERNTTVWHAMNMGASPMVTFDGDPVVFALIAQPIWNAIVAAAGDNTDPLTTIFTDIFGDDAAPTEMYGSHLPEVEAPLRELAAVNEYLRHREQPWSPPKDYDQYWEHEMQAKLDRARDLFSDDIAVLRGLEAYTPELNSLLQLRRE